MKNTIENLVIALFTVLFTVIAIHFVAIKPLERQITSLNETVLELAKIERYKIENDFAKMKPKKGSDIIIDLDNSLEVNKLQIRDTIPYETRDHEGFFKRLFNSKKEEK